MAKNKNTSQVKDQLNIEGDTFVVVGAESGRVVYGGGVGVPLNDAQKLATGLVAPSNICRFENGEIGDVVLTVK